MVQATRSRHTPERRIRCARCRRSTWRGALAVGFPRSSSGSANGVSATDVASTSTRRATAAMSGSEGWSYPAARVSPPSSTERHSEHPDSGRLLPSCRLGRSADIRPLGFALLRRSSRQRAEGGPPERARWQIQGQRSLRQVTAWRTSKVPKIAPDLGQRSATHPERHVAEPRQGYDRVVTLAKLKRLFRRNRRAAG
jgi:hypothetical protein